MDSTSILISKALPKNLRRLRKRKKLTQLELANLCGYSRGYLADLERGATAASMAVLQKLLNALEVPVADLLTSPEVGARSPSDSVKVAILNSPSSDCLVSPVKKGSAQDGFLMPSLRAGDSFALYLPDNSMSPGFGKGDLVVFSLSRKPKDGEACLVDTGKGQTLFRTALALPGGQWRLQPGNPKFGPMVIRASKRLQMWPVVGFWRTLKQTGRDR